MPAPRVSPAGSHAHACMCTSYGYLPARWYNAPAAYRYFLPSMKMQFIVPCSLVIANNACYVARVLASQGLAALPHERAVLQTRVRHAAPGGMERKSSKQASPNACRAQRVQIADLLHASMTWSVYARAARGTA